MPDQPNILFLFPDQWRWDWLGCEISPYGDVPVRTPNIDALAARGVRFSQCRSNSPLCSPARACLALGQRYEKTGVPTNEYDVDPTRTTVFNLLRDAGYRVGTTGKNDLHKATKWKGHDGWTQLLGQYGFTEATDHSGKLDAKNHGATSPHCSYTAHLHRHGWMQAYVDDYARRQTEASNTTAAWPSPLPRRFYTDDVCGQRSVEMLEQFPEEGPWMLWVNWPGPHDPFDPPRELQQRYDGVEFPEPIDPPTHDKHGNEIDHQQIRRNYAACCENIDEWVGRILDAVDQRGELDNTLIIFGSDHGEMLGDHGCWTKTDCYEGSMHVPLIVAGPGGEQYAHRADQGRACDDPVELIDISASMLAAAGLSIPDHWDARALPLRDGDPARELQFSAMQLENRNAWRAACDGRYKLVVDNNGDAKLFDLHTDPTERQNFTAQNPGVVERLGNALEAQAPA